MSCHSAPDCLLTLGLFPLLLLHNFWDLNWEMYISHLGQHTQKSLVLNTVKTYRLLHHKKISFSDLLWYIFYQSCSCPIILLQFEFSIKWSWNVILNIIYHHSLRYISHCLSYFKRSEKEGVLNKVKNQVGWMFGQLLKQFLKELWSNFGQHSHCVSHDSNSCVIHPDHTQDNNQRGWWLESSPTVNLVARQKLLLWRDVGGTWPCLPQTVNVFIWFKNPFTTKSQQTLAYLCKHAENWTGRACEESTHEVLERWIKLNTIC